MEKINQILANLLASISTFWGKLTLLQKGLGIGAVVLAIAGISSLFFVQNKSQYQYLFVDLSTEDVNAISQFLARNNINDFQIDQKGIQVPSKDVNSIRVMLSQEGLPNKGVVGWEQFDNQDFTRTEFEQQIQRLRAIQGELSRTIGSIEGITSARVHIVMPKHSVFVRDEQKPTAAIYVKTKRGFELERKQIKGIQHLVSRSVEGLEPSQVTIISAEGRLLTEIESTDPAVTQSKELLEYRLQIEKQLEDRVRVIVGRVVGPDRVEAKVDADVDFTQEKRTISDVDPDKLAVVSKNSTGFSMEGQGLNPTGIPGSKSNVPGEQENLVANTSKAGSKRESELVNYEFSKTVSQKTMAVGRILRLTISAIVDGKQIYPGDGSIPEFIGRTPEEMKQIESIIKDAVGYKDGRDSLTVQNMMFQLDPFQVMEIKKQKTEDRAYLSTLVVSAVVALALVLFFAFIVRPYFRWLSYDPEKKEGQSIVEEYKPDLELGSMQNVQIKEDVPFEKLSAKEQVFYLARNEPKRTTEAIRIMLSPNQSSN